MNAMEQLKRNYKLPFLHLEMNVLVNGNAGKVIGTSNCGLKARIIDNGKIVCFHPTWETCYFDEK